MSSTESGATSRIAVGTSVADSDGKHLGKVSEITESYFKLDVHMARDYWLAMDTIASADGEAIVLRAPDHELSKQFSAVEELGQGELDGSISLDEVANAEERRLGAQAEFLEERGQA